MKKFFIVFVFSVITTTVAFAQQNYQDVVYLKNGSIIRGVIIEQVPNKLIKIETADRSVFVYQMDEIEKFTKEPFKGNGENPGNTLGLKAGYRGIIEIGYQFKVGDYGMDRLKFNFINGYQIIPYFSLGFGTGLRYYFDAKAAVIPIFADLRSHLLNKKISPYLSMGIGYSFDATNKFESVGFFLNPDLGVSIRISNNSAINVGVGYEMQKMKFYHYFYPYYNEFTDNSGAISIDVGISF